MRSLVLLICLFSISNAAAETLAYIGTYTRGSSEGIYVAEFDPQSGKLSEPKLADAEEQRQAGE